ncbi:hypothetical protein CU044_0155 [Streptomyces sp. L-9-10]|nr:hypothetical protein CU044_0155 [Streptomyces sp. L-9-10]
MEGHWRAGRDRGDLVLFFSVAIRGFSVAIRGPFAEDPGSIP